MPNVENDLFALLADAGQVALENLLRFLYRGEQILRRLWVGKTLLPCSHDVMPLAACGAEADY